MLPRKILYTKHTQKAQVTFHLTPMLVHRRFSGGIRYERELLEIPKKIEELQKKDIQELANRAVKEGNPTYPVPEIWEKSQFLNLYEKMI